MVDLPHGAVDDRHAILIVGDDVAGLRHDIGCSRRRVKPADVEFLALDEQDAGRAGAADRSHFVLVLIGHQADEHVDEILARAVAEDLGRSPANVRRLAVDGDQGQDLRRDRLVDPAENVDQNRLVGLATAGKLAVNRQDGPGIRDLVELGLGQILFRFPVGAVDILVDLLQHAAPRTCLPSSAPGLRRSVRRSPNGFRAS